MYVILNSKYNGQTGKRICDVYAPSEADLPNETQVHGGRMKGGPRRSSH